MGDYTAKRIGDMEAVFRGSFKRARAELGVEAFGMHETNHSGLVEAIRPAPRRTGIKAMAAAAGVAALLFAHLPLDDSRTSHATHYASIASALSKAHHGGPQRRFRRVLGRGFFECYHKTKWVLSHKKFYRYFPWFL